MMEMKLSEKRKRERPKRFLDLVKKIWKDDVKQMDVEDMTVWRRMTTFGEGCLEKDET